MTTSSRSRPGHGAAVPRLRWRADVPRDRARTPPRLRNVAGVPAEDRHASALELFFDMVFVVAVAELAAALLADPSPAGLLRYLALFVPVWWAWVGYTFYADRFDGDDTCHRAVMIGAMLAVVALAAALPDAFTEHGSVRFVCSYVAVRLLLIALYVRAHRHVPPARPLTGRYLAVFALGAAVWLASLLVDPPARYVVWAVCMLVELLPPLLFSRVIAALPYHLSHIPERFGLFTIIVLGESVALGAAGVSGGEPEPGALAVWACGLLVTAAQWWLYFDCLDHAPLRRWRRTGQAYLYGHLVVFAGITASGAGTLLAVRTTASPPGDPAHGAAAGGSAHGEVLPGAVAVPSPSTAAWVLCGGVAAFLVGVGFIHYVATAPRGDAQAWSRLGLGAAAALGAVVLPVLAPAVPVLGVLTGLLVVLSTQVAFELAVLARRGTDRV